MKPDPTTESPRQIVWRSKLDLSVHDAVAATPEDRSLIELLVDELARGERIHDPLEITPDGEILDGRHRWKASLRVKSITTLPVVVVDQVDPEMLVCAKLTQRRHYSKSAKAYALRHLAAKVAQAGREARAGNLKVGSDPRKPTESAFGKKGSETLTELAAKSGLSVDVLQQAIKLERDYMTRADKLIEDWLDLQINTDAAADWEEWRNTHPNQDMPWSCWRAAALAKMGCRDTDPKSVNLIPKNYREIEEDKIFNGVPDPDSESDERKSYSLGASLKALGSVFATAGKPRPDLDPSTPDVVIVLGNKLKAFTKTMWAQWSDISQPERLAVCKQFAEAVHEWPDDACAALLVALKQR